jgi:hypothetical protein
MPAPEPGEQRAWPLLGKGAPAAGVAIALDLHLLLRHDLPPFYKILSLDPLNPKDNRLAAICILYFAPPEIPFSGGLTTIN